MKDETHLMFLITSHYFEVNVTCISMTPGFKLLIKKMRFFQKHLLR